jgi:precorrin-6A/cobalt-precorrin-6A reductase
MQDAIEQGGYTAILDASHVFDRLATEQAFAASEALGLPYLRIERPEWDASAHQT